MTVKDLLSTCLNMHSQDLQIVICKQHGDNTLEELDDGSSIFNKTENYNQRRIKTWTFTQSRITIIIDDNV